MISLKHKIYRIKLRVFNSTCGICVKRQIWFKATSEAHKLEDLSWESLDMIRENLREESE